MTPYQKWLNAGRPYWEGLSLFHQVQGHYPLKKTLGRGPSPYNSAKLQAVLKAHFSGQSAVGSQRSAVSGQRSAARGGQRPRAASRELPPPPPATGSSQLEARGSELPEEPYSSSAYKGLPWADLPTPLQQWRVQTTERFTRRRVLHRKLVEEGEGLPAKERLAICREIVELTDAISEYWAAERAFAKSGALPAIPPTEAERVANLTGLQAMRELTNRVRPKVWRLRSNLKVDGDKMSPEKRLSVEMELADAEHLKALLVARVAEYDKQRK